MVVQLLREEFPWILQLIVVAVFGLSYYYLSQKATLKLNQIQQKEEVHKVPEIKAEASALLTLAHLSLFLLLFFLAMLLSRISGHVVRYGNNILYPDNNFPFILLIVLSLFFLNYLSIKRFYLGYQVGEHVSSTILRGIMTIGVFLSMVALVIILVYTLVILRLIE